MAELALNLVLWGSGVILVLAVALVGALAKAERPRRTRILRDTTNPRKDLP